MLSRGLTALKDSGGGRTRCTGLKDHMINGKRGLSSRTKYVPEFFPQENL